MNRMLKQTPRFLSAILLSFALISCSSISLVGMYKLSKVDPLSADPAQIKVAIKTDKVIKVNDGAVKIKFGYQSDDGTIDINDEFDVNIDYQSAIAQSLFTDIATNEYVTVLSLNESDAKKFRQNQFLISKHKTEDKKGQGYFSLGLDNFCLPNPLPERELTVDVFLQTERQDGFFKFLSDVDLKDQFEDIEPEDLKTLQDSCQQS